MTETVLGLRERKKLRARAALADAALQLSVERGLAQVTIEDIAAAADFSPRTFSNYFSCKEEAVVASGSEDLAELVTHFQTRPDGEPPMESLRALATEWSRGVGTRGARAQQMDLLEHNDSLLPYQMALYANLERDLTKVIAERTGTGLGTHPYPWLVAAAAVSAIKTSMRVWTSQGCPDGELPALVDLAFDQIGAGLPVPRQP